MRLCSEIKKIKKDESYVETIVSILMLYPKKKKHSQNLIFAITFFKCCLKILLEYV